MSRPFTASRRVDVITLPEATRRRFKRSFTTRRVPESAMRTVVTGSIRPRAGDLVLARVTRLGQHQKLECPDGRRATMHVGDLIVVTYADRYAPDQFEAEVPMSLEPTNLVASGGVAAHMITRSREVRNATDIAPVGLIGDDRGQPINIADFALSPVTPARPRPRTIGVIGTSMNSGKTTTVRYLAHGLTRAGYRVGTTKVTGTGSGGDYWVMLDAGVHQMLDFTDVGLASTYRQPVPLLEEKLVELVDHLTEGGADVILVEVADGSYQLETSALIRSEVFRETIDAVFFAAGDALGAVAGVEQLQQLGHDVVGVSGRITRSPLATREAESQLGTKILTIADLMEAGVMAGRLGLDPLVIAQDVRTDPWPILIPGLAAGHERDWGVVGSHEGAALDGVGAR